MLILKTPIQLHTNLGLTGNAELFSQRIRGNYGFLGAKYAPKDLLFLLTAPPELPEALGGMTMLVSQQTLVDAGTTTLDVVTNVINRILLDGTNQFTYQDQVYITGVLNKLGITNVEQFMAQVRQLRAESESTMHLTQLYRAELERVMQLRLAGEPAPALPLPPARAEGADPVRYGDTNSVDLTVVRQGDTTEVLDAVGELRETLVEVRGETRRSDKERTDEETRTNRGEISRLTGEEIPDRDPMVSMSLQILKRLDAANLYETVHAFQRNWAYTENHFQRNELRLSEQLRFSNSVVLAELKQQVFREPGIHLRHHLNQYEAGTILEIPVSEEQVLSQAAAAALVTAVDNTVTQVLNRPQFRREQWLRLENALYQTAENTLSRFETYHSSYHPRLAETRPDIQIAWNTYAQELQEYLALYHQIHTSDTAPWRVPGVPGAASLLLNHLTRIEEGDQLGGEIRSEYNTGTEERRLLLRELISPGAARILPVPGLPGRERPVYREFRQVEKETIRESRMEETEKLAYTGSLSGFNRIPERALPPDEIPPAPQLPPLELTAAQAEEQAPEALQEQLTRIDQHNKTILHFMQQASVQHSAPVMPKGPDMRRTMQDSLRALEEPEMVLREIYEEGQREKRGQSTLSPQQESILRQLPPSDRAVYERLLVYQKDPEAAMAQGLVRPGNLGGLNAELHLVQAEQTEESEPTERSIGTERLTSDTETVLERFLHKPARLMREEIRPPVSDEVRIVHKQAPPGITEELLERLQQNTTLRTTVEESVEQVNRQSVHRTDITATEQQVVRQTTEDITELVNRTLMRQMRTISDQVYRQMEKRLQTERSRRGRL